MNISILLHSNKKKNDDPYLRADLFFSWISVILFPRRKADIMYKKFTPNELNKMNHKTFPGSEGCLIPFISRIFLLYRKQANKIEFTAFLSYRKQRLQIRIFP